jgi:hypothetical protein
VFAVNGCVDWLPLVATACTQPPDAVQFAAAGELQVRTLLPPLAIASGLAINVMAGAPTGLTEIWVLATLLVPPMPLQVSEYEVVVVSGPVDWLPLVAIAPDQPPEPVQPLATVELHVNVDVPPFAMLVGIALSATVGSGATATVAETGTLVPPAPLQVNV